MHAYVGLCVLASDCSGSLRWCTLGMCVRVSVRARARVCVCIRMYVCVCVCVVPVVVSLALGEKPRSMQLNNSLI